MISFWHLWLDASISEIPLAWANRGGWHPLLRLGAHTHLLYVILIPSSCCQLERLAQWLGTKKMQQWSLGFPTLNWNICRPRWSVYNWPTVQGQLPSAIAASGCSSAAQPGWRRPRQYSEKLFIVWPNLCMFVRGPWCSFRILSCLGLIQTSLLTSLIVTFNFPFLHFAGVVPKACMIDLSKTKSN